MTPRYLNRLTTSFLPERHWYELNLLLLLLLFLEKNMQTVFKWTIYFFIL